MTRYCSKCQRDEGDTTFSPGTVNGGYCIPCNRDAVFKVAWRKKLKQGGPEVLNEQMMDLIRRLNLLRELLEEG